MTELEPLSVTQFSDFFAAIQGYSPFDWQKMLADQVAAEGWPDVIDLPTASGKTACMDVAIFNLALQAGMKINERTSPRRIWFVVDRRIVVDEAYERARRISLALEFAIASDQRRKEIRSESDTREFISKLEKREHTILSIVARRLLHIAGTKSSPLAIARLRGGVPRRSAWAYNPAQPAVITSTVDQIGSRLLFRAYGSGTLAAPIHAGLAANDSLIILDEGHLSTPFEQTVQQVKRFRKIGTHAEDIRTPFAFVMMSATPPIGNEGSLATFPKISDRPVALKHPLLRQRAIAAKPARLIEVASANEENDPLVDRAVKEAIVLRGSRSRIAIMVNRVKTAQAIYAQLGESEEFHRVLLTGRLRPVERDQLIQEWNDKLRSDSTSDMDRPLILVTTQCLEVGADYSFDSLITECASLDSLRQRFGRLNRLGNDKWSPSDAVILIRKSQTAPEGKLKEEDPIYGHALARTWNWLVANSNIIELPVAGDEPIKAKKTKKRSTPSFRSIDMGIDALGAKLPSDAVELSSLLAPRENAPILLPAYIDLLSQTGPRPAIEPDISVFLHGPQRSMPEASVVWRCDLGDKSDNWEEIVSLMPPLGGEKLSVPIFRLKKWLEDSEALPADDTGDTESQKLDIINEKSATKSKPFVIWRGKSAINLSSSPWSIRSGDTVVVPANYGLPSSIGQCLEENPIDIYESALPVAQEKQVLRIHRACTPEGMDTDRSVEWENLLSLATLVDEPISPIEFLETAKQFKPANAIGDPRKQAYPDQAGQILIWKSKLEPSKVEIDACDFDDLELITDTKCATLQYHTDYVTELAKRFGALCLAPFVDSIERAAKYHDLGKADDRFQHCLKNGHRFGPPVLLAKSTGDISQSRWQQLRELTTLPKDFRHEMLSLQIVQSQLKLTVPEFDLLLHLIASHHGHGRPFAPISPDDESIPVELELCGMCFSIAAADRTQHPPHSLDSGIGERFWKLTRKYGWWGLAYAEAMLRLADQHASREGDSL